MVGVRTNENNKMKHLIKLLINHILIITVLVLSFQNHLSAADLYIGSAEISITPDKPVALCGQMRTRISKGVTSEIKATALALESREGEISVDTAIMISCDLTLIIQKVIDKTRSKLKTRIPEFDTHKLILNATHTHTAPVVRTGVYRIPEEGVMQPEEYLEFLADRLADVAVKAWNSKKKGSVGYGLGHAVVAQNRRSVFEDGHAQMYGRSFKKGWRKFEGYEDHGVEVLFFWNENKKLIATSINVACPAQEVENDSKINADYWHQVRESLKEKHGNNLHVLTWIGAAGDQSPHLMLRMKSENRMRKLRGLSRLDEISRRIVRAWNEAYAGAKQEIMSDVLFVHHVKTIELPVRNVTEEEYYRVKTEVEGLKQEPVKYRFMVWKQEVLKKYKQQKKGTLKPYQMELHVIRLGDIAIATNDFELFTDFGIQMKAQSKALQTFVIQLAGPGTYVPSFRAEQGGGYSAVIESNYIGSEGGQILTDETINLINSLWVNE
jgi:hypothetical protein